MALATRDLSVLAYANGFTLWHYTTNDTAAAVLADGYFAAARDLLRQGDMLLLTADGRNQADMLVVCANEPQTVVRSLMGVRT